MAPLLSAHLTVMLAGQCKAGGASGSGFGSTTVKVVVHVPTLPRESATLSVIRWTPGPTNVPGGGSGITTPPGAPPTVLWPGGQLSVKVVLERKSGTGARQARTSVVPAPTTATAGGGQVTVGGVVSPKKRQVGHPYDSNLFQP